MSNEHNDLPMKVLHLSREAVIDQITVNLLAAGVIHEDEMSMHLRITEMLDPKELIALLMESYKMREEADVTSHYYIIDPVHLSSN